MENLISFCVNTARNEINHIKLLFKSFEKNLHSKEHEIIVFIDSDNQNTFEWLLTQKEIFPNLKILRNNLPVCYGYSRNINEMFEQAKHPIVSYLQSDMVICKDYDLEVLKELKPGMFLCSTRVEPPLHPAGPEKITHDFGLDPTQFDLDAWTEFAEANKKDDLTMYFFAPFTLYKDVWLSVGGHNTLFRRSREDSDVLIRLVLNNTIIKQTWRALAYHFTCTSSRGHKWFESENKEAQERLKIQQLADRHELDRFIINWGNFKHGDLTEKGYIKNKYYKVSAKINNIQDVNKFLILENFFNKVYVEDPNFIKLTQGKYDYQHEAANTLLNISKEDWETYSYMYNKLDSSERIFTLDKLNDQDDIIIEFDCEKITNDHVHTFLMNLQDIIDQTEDTGKFQYGPFIIQINNKINRASEKSIITNPQVKPEHLYSIH